MEDFVIDKVNDHNTNSNRQQEYANVGKQLYRIRCTASELLQIHGSQYDTNHGAMYCRAIIGKGPRLKMKLIKPTTDNETIP